MKYGYFKLYFCVLHCEPCGYHSKLLFSMLILVVFCCRSYLSYLFSTCHPIFTIYLLAMKNL